uniref:Uncharacterized protein n=1 Tax=Oscillatoriales cyanobacterium SpSt-402 TaxID=2282168 RepID=A0A832H5N0_9CYAN
MKTSRLKHFKIVVLFLSLLTFTNSSLLEKTLAQPVSEFQKNLITGRIPIASTRTIVSPKIFTNCPNQCNSLGDVATALNIALRKAGYAQQAWYLVEDPYRTQAVTAVVTELENIRSDGHPHTAKRWTTSYYSPSIESFQDFLRRMLIGAPPGRYRSFLFAFTPPDRPLSQSLPSWSTLEKTADTIRRGNRVPVVKSLATVRSANYQCYVYVYEYERSSVNGAVRFIEESTLTAEQHLRGGGIWQTLGLR